MTKKQECAPRSSPEGDRKALWSLPQERNLCATYTNKPERRLPVMKKIVLTGGGTMGHVTPNLALLPHLLAAGYEVHYIGTENGMEA
ncbi:protein containing Glycosyl transferase, family 28 domain protein, partial [human gut metagenome]